MILVFQSQKPRRQPSSFEAHGEPPVLCTWSVSVWRSFLKVKRKPLALPSNHSLDITTFISSHLLTQHHNDNKVAFIDASTGRHLSFADVWKGVESVSTCLSEMGIRKGDVVLLLSPNSIFFPIVCLSVMSLGAIITPANPLNTASEIAKQIVDSKATLVFIYTVGAGG